MNEDGFDTNIDENIAFLSELFPDQDLEFILDSFLRQNCNFDQTIKFLLSDHQIESKPLCPFDHLVKTFPDVEIEAIEAFLLTQDESKDLEILEKEFMKQMTVTSSLTRSKPRDRPLKMKLSDFNSLLKTSKDANIKTQSPRTLRVLFTCKLI